MSTQTNWPKSFATSRATGHRHKTILQEEAPAGNRGSGS